MTCVNPISRNKGVGRTVQDVLKIGVSPLCFSIGRCPGHPGTQGDDLNSREEKGCRQDHEQHGVHRSASEQSVHS